MLLILYGQARQVFLCHPVLAGVLEPARLGIISAPCQSAARHAVRTEVTGVRGPAMLGIISAPYQFAAKCAIRVELTGVQVPAKLLVE